MLFNKKEPEQEQEDHGMEVVDAQNRPLAILSKRSVHRQLLMHRSVQVLVYNQEKRLFLQKRNRKKRFFPGRWDVSSRTHPRVGESTLDAALRTLKAELNLEGEHPQLVRELPAGPKTGFEHVSLYVVSKTTQLITPNEDAVDEGFYYSQEELTCLIKEFRELLTPNLVVLWEAGLLNPANR